MKTLLVVFVLGLALPAGADKPTEGKVSIFVKAATDENGWENAAISDSAEDLRGKIGGKWLERTDSEEEADLVVVVTNRFFQGSGVIQSHYNPYSRTATAGELQLRIVTIQIVARDGNTMDGYGYDTLLWKNAANGGEEGGRAIRGDELQKDRLPA